MLGIVSVMIPSDLVYAQALDMSNLSLMFDEDFKTLDVSPHGPRTRWIAHTPWGGDFGDAAFADPRPGFPFSHQSGFFCIELRKMPNGHWQSGLLATNEPHGNGFSLQYGYFEMRAKLPGGPGVWPAFWLDSMPGNSSPDPSTEIDVMEQYGKFPAAFNSTVTVWNKDHGIKPKSTMHINRVPEGSLSAAFHDYGVLVDPHWVTFFLDRQQIWRTETPPEHKHGLGILVDLGLGSGWPINETPSPSFMYIDYVRAYRLKQGPG